MKRDGQNLYQQVAATMAELIHARVLRAGDRMPSMRRAKSQHGVSQSTIFQAWLQLENDGLIEARPRSGYFVRAVRPPPSSKTPVARASKPLAVVGTGALQADLFSQARRPGVVPLGAASPGPDLFPWEKLSRTMAVVSRRMGRHGLSYDMPPGSEALRRQIARRSLDWGAALPADGIITACGGTEALMLCLRAVTKPGDVVAVESPTYFCILQAIEELGLKALEIPLHPLTGMDLDVLEQAVGKRRIAACVAVPNFNNPQGSLMPDAHKQRLLAILTRRGIPLIEDDIYGDLHFGPQRPRVVQSWDQSGLVMLCGSFSKTLAPGYRVGWVAPGRYYDRVLAMKLTSTLATGTLTQEAIAEFVANGGYDHYLRGIRQTYATQVQQMAKAVLDCFPQGVSLSEPAGGFVLWVELPASIQAMELQTRALAEGISIAPGPMFSARQGFHHFIRLNSGHPWNPRMERAISTLGVLVKKML